MGNLVADPDSRNSPMTAMYVAAHSTQTDLRITNDAYARYSTTASPTVEDANT